VPDRVGSHWHHNRSHGRRSDQVTSISVRKDPGSPYASNHGHAQGNEQNMETASIFSHETIMQQK